jgi:integrase
MIARAKPAKPYEGFPLTAHANGQWCKKIRKVLHYFGPWENWQAALNLYLEQKDYLQAGRKPRKADENEPTLAYALNAFLSFKQVAAASGKIKQRTYAEYEQTCDRIAACIGKSRVLSDIDVDDFTKLRETLSKGRGVASQKGDLTRARMVFLFANENIIEKPVRYRTPLASPSRKQFRQARNERGPRLFSRSDINQLIKAASPQMKAMIYLGINCGFGNTDCGLLSKDSIDLDKGWHTFARPKTETDRRCPLWPETIKAVRAAMAIRPENETEETAHLVLVTRCGNPWTDRSRKLDNAITIEFRKLLNELGIYRKHATTFYSLRRTFETVGATAGEQVAVDYIMGHTPDASDMAAVYRQKMYDGPLLKVTNHVRNWLNGKIKIE